MGGGPCPGGGTGWGSRVGVCGSGMPPPSPSFMLFPRPRHPPLPPPQISFALPGMRGPGGGRRGHQSGTPRCWGKGSSPRSPTRPPPARHPRPTREHHHMQKVGNRNQYIILCRRYLRNKQTCKIQGFRKGPHPRPPPREGHEPVRPATPTGRR